MHDAFQRRDATAVRWLFEGHPEFRERMAQVQQHVAEFHPSELTLVAKADAGAVELGVAVPAGPPTP